MVFDPAFPEHGLHNSRGLEAKTVSQRCRIAGNLAASHAMASAKILEAPMSVNDIHRDRHCLP